MSLPEFDAFPSEPYGPGRIYRVAKTTQVAVFRFDAPLPHAPDGGFLLYVFVEKKRRVGRWEWASGGPELRRVMEAYRATTSPDYVPPEWEAPGGEMAMIRPPIRDFVKHAMEHGRPDPPEKEPPEWLITYFPLEKEEPSA